jgi:hypothetical protein
MKKLSAITSTILLSLALCFQSCYRDNEEDLYGKNANTCDTSTATYAAFVSPLLSSKCATSGCHNAASASAGVNLSNYTVTKAYLTNAKSAFLGAIKHSSSFSPMPQGSAKLPDCDIAKLEAWINAGMLNN